MHPNKFCVPYMNNMLSCPHILSVVAQFVARSTRGCEPFRPCLLFRAYTLYLPSKAVEEIYICGARCGVVAPLISNFLTELD